MSAETIRQRLAAATPTEWIAASGKGKLSVVGTKDANSHSYALAVFSAVPATHRKADAELTAHAPADLALLLDLVEAAQALSEQQHVCEDGDFTDNDQAASAFDALYAAWTAMRRALERVEAGE